MKLIDRYVGRGVVITTIYGLFVLSLVLVLGNIFKELLDLMINRDVPVKYLFMFMLYVLPFSFTFTVPWAFLTAVLLVFGRMSADNETVALRACGTSLLRVCLPVLGVAVLLSAFTFWINTTIAPQALDAMRNSIATIARSNPQSLFVADEVFLSGTAAKITPVRRVESTDMPGQRPIMNAIRDRLTAITEGRDPTYDNWVTRIRVDG